jgi:uncharacterized membrane protein
MIDILKKEKTAIAVIIIALIVFFAAFWWLNSDKAIAEQGSEYVEYEKGTVVTVLSDTLEQDPASDNAFRGEQMLTVKVQSGQYKGEELLTYNYAGPLYGVPLKEGDKVVISISTHANGDHQAVVYEYNRIPALAIVIVLFILATILVGGKTGLKSLVGLFFTVLCLFAILIPWLLKGAPTLPATFAVCVFVALVSFTILGGVHRKTICAFLGTVSGTAIAMAFGLMAQSLTRINGLRISDVEPLLQLRQTGTPIGLRGLLIAGIIISSLGAVMDVAMSISSSLEEIHTANPDLDSRQLFKSGMNIGRDMVGTMTNTLILAFLGSGFVLIIYLYSLGLSFYQLFSSAYASIEVISGISSSIGMILAIQLTALISSVLLARDKTK